MNFTIPDVDSVPPVATIKGGAPVSLEVES